MSFDLKKEMEKLLDDYSDEVKDAVDDSIEEVTDFAVKELKTISPKRKIKGGGKYARSWAKEIDRHGLKVEGVVYNKGHYQLTHLLEHGHATRNGNGRTDYNDTPAYPHIEKVNDSMQEKFMEELERRLSK